MPLVVGASLGDQGVEEALLGGVVVGGVFGVPLHREGPRAVDFDAFAHAVVGVSGDPPPSPSRPSAW